jgi:hypothetical protein
VADLKIGHFNIKPKSTVASKLRASRSDCATQKAAARRGERPLQSSRLGERWAAAKRWRGRVA